MPPKGRTPQNKKFTLRNQRYYANRNDVRRQMASSHRIWVLTLLRHPVCSHSVASMLPTMHSLGQHLCPLIFSRSPLLRATHSLPCHSPCHCRFSCHSHPCLDGGDLLLFHDLPHANEGRSIVVMMGMV
jgi:hypothetical protein